MIDYSTKNYDTSKWSEIYPNFKIIKHNIDDLENTFKDQVDFSIFKNRGQKIDVLKYLLMDKFGGIYSDREIVPTKKIKNIDNNGFLKCGPYFSNQVMMGKPNQDIWKQLIMESIKRVKQNTSSSLGNLYNRLKTTGSLMITDVINSFDELISTIPNFFKDLRSKYSWIFFLIRNWKQLITFFLILIIVIIFILFEVIYKLNRCCNGYRELLYVN